MSNQVNDENVGLLKQLVTTVQKKNDKEKVDNSIKMKPAKVIGVDEDTYKVFAYFIDDAEQNAYTFYNKSGEVLTEGDNVRVYYTTNPAKGWIGARMGEPVYPEVDSGGTEVVITTNQAKHMMNNYEVIRVVDGDTHCYGAVGNNIIVSGIEVPFYDANALNDIPDSLFRWNLSGLYRTYDSDPFVYHDVVCRCTKIHLSNNILMFSSYPFIDGKVWKSSGLSYNKNTVGYLPCYTGIYPSYDGEGYGGITYQMVRRYYNEDGNIEHYATLGIGTFRSLGFMSAEERDAAMAIVNFEGTAE